MYCQLLSSANLYVERDFFKCGGTNGDVWRGNSSFKGEKATQAQCIRSICEATKINRIRNKANDQSERKVER